jgi:hypothetical protein
MFATVVFDSWHFAVALCQVIRFYQMHFITQSTSNRIGQTKRRNRLQVRYANMGCLNLPRYGRVFATLAYNPKRFPQKFLLVTNNFSRKWAIGD